MADGAGPRSTPAWISPPRFPPHVRSTTVLPALPGDTRAGGHAPETTEEGLVLAPSQRLLLTWASVLITSSPVKSEGFSLPSRSTILICNLTRNEGQPRSGVPPPGRPGE